MQEAPALPEEHEKWMRTCLALGHKALQTGNPPVGAVVVKANEIIGEGIEAGKSKNDITCHAEIEAIRDALKKSGGIDLAGCTLYSTHEPCLMCAYVIRHYKISRVVTGTPVPLVGGFSSAYPLLTVTDISTWTRPPQLVTGVLEAECRALTRAYAQKNPKIG